MTTTVAPGRNTGARALVDELGLDNYYAFHATRADLLRRLGRDADAGAAYTRAAALAPTNAERDFLQTQARRPGYARTPAIETIEP